MVPGVSDLSGLSSLGEGVRRPGVWEVTGCRGARPRGGRDCTAPPCAAPGLRRGQPALPANRDSLHFKRKTGQQSPCPPHSRPWPPSIPSVRARARQRQGCARTQDGAPARRQAPAQRPRLVTLGQMEGSGVPMPWTQKGQILGDFKASWAQFFGTGEPGGIWLGRLLLPCGEGPSPSMPRSHHVRRTCFRVASTEGACLHRPL